MALGKSGGKGANKALIIKSIGACVALPQEKKKVPCVVVAYALSAQGTQVSFLALPLPPKGKLYGVQDFLGAIAAAEKADSAEFTDSESRPLDILFCRAEEGQNLDVVPRNTEKNCYGEGFAQVSAGKLRFRAKLPATPWKLGEKMAIPVSAEKDDSETDSYGYAVVNAYNACLLGKIAMCEELYLETRDYKRVKIEMRASTSRYVEDEVMYVRPVCREGEGYIEYYLTEEFNYNDGNSVSRRRYQIKYSERLGGYNVTRV